MAKVLANSSVHTRIQIIIIFVFIFCSISYSQTLSQNTTSRLYSEKIKLNIRQDVYEDKVILFRNYFENNDDKRVVSNGTVTNGILDKLIWETKYLSVHLKYQKDLDRFSFVSYEIKNKTDTIAHYFSCNRKTKKAVEMIRFKIKYNKIAEINVLPCCYDGFIPVEEFEKIEHRID